MRQTQYMQRIMHCLAVLFLITTASSNSPSFSDNTQRSVKLNNYGNWSYYNIDGMTWQVMLNVFAKYDNVVISSTPAFTQIVPDSVKTRHPQAKVYRYFALMCKPVGDSNWDDPTDATHAAMLLSRADIDENNWWLRDGNGNIARESDMVYYLDVGKPGFKEAYLQAMLSWMNGKGYDGVMFDYWLGYLPRPYFGSSEGWIRPLPAAYPTDQDWFVKAWKPFIQYVMAGLHSAGYRIIGNCAGEYSSTNSVSNWQRTQVDGTVYEQWALDWAYNGGVWLPGNVIERRIYDLANDPLEMWTDEIGLSGSDPEYARKNKVCLAVYYIGVPPNQENRSFSSNRTAGVYWDPLWDLNIGKPVAPAQKIGNYSWSRKYTQGLVLLNYEEHKYIRYTLDRVYQDESGDVFSGAVTLSPHTAMILAQVPDIAGRVILDAYGGDMTKVPMTVELRRKGGGAETRSTSLTASGGFVLRGVQAGTYDIYLKPSHWLAKVYRGVTMNGDTTLSTTTFTNGDVLNNNEVDMDDFLEVVHKYGALPGDANWDTSADLNGSGEIDWEDAEITLARYGNYGDF